MHRKDAIKPVTTITKIVLAEDHALMREGLKMLLGTEPGFEVAAETGDGLAVEALVRTLRPQLLLLDLDLPGRHGVLIATAVKAEFDAAVKVLVLTGDLRPNSVRDALAAGADGYVHKSEDSTELLQAVHAVLAGRQFVSKNIAAAFHPQAQPLGAMARSSAGSIPVPAPGSTAGASSGHAPGAPLDSLSATPREREIMSLVARGHANGEIAELLVLSVHTVRTHRQNLMAKFSLRNAAEITAYAVQRGYYSPG